ncbi:MAG: DNA-binding response regulator [Caldilinea sp. CFX5]|nr:DNA-binding response regulator [Caldilinea sp. CFX5]
MLVDHDAVIHSGLKTLLCDYEDIQIMVEAADGEEAVRLCTLYRPDVMLMEMMLPRMNGLAATRVIHARHPNIQVVMFTNTANYALIREALTAGATGYWLKNASSEELVKAIRHAHRGYTTLSPEVTQTLLHGALEHKLPVGYDLTSREREVLKLLVAGMNNCAIAQSLTVSRSTIKFHVSNILAKLHAKTRTQAIALALRHNLVAQAQ